MWPGSLTPVRRAGDQSPGSATPATAYDTRAPKPLIYCMPPAKTYGARTIDPQPVTLADIRSARRRIAGGVVVTPCPESIPLSEITGARIFCKLDNLQRTGSFKERGARNALLRLPKKQQRRGVIAASAGNHALGLAYHGQLLGIPVTVVMPDYAPLIKVSTCRRLGARVVIQGRDFAEARAGADALAARDGLAYIHGFD